MIYLLLKDKILTKYINSHLNLYFTALGVFVCLQLKLYSLGKVLGNAMDSDNIDYSDQLQATVNRMIEQDPRERQGMAELLKVTDPQ